MTLAAAAFVRCARRALVAWLCCAAAAAHAAAPAEPACPPLPTVDSAPARDRGLLWRLTRDGRVSYLFGTLHIGRPGWERFGPRTAAALAQAEVLALEIDPTDPAGAQALGAPGAAPEPLPAPLAARLQRAFERACLPAAALAALHPVLQTTLLAISEARWLGLDLNHSQELLLAQAAQATGRRVRALETVAQQRDLLISGTAGQTQALVEQTLAQLDSGAGRRVLAQLIDAWVQGDLATLERYESWCECAASADDLAALRAINDDRNPALAAGIAALHGTRTAGQRVFAAVGALHMTGPQALPLLLQRMGFRVERVPFGAPAAP